MRLALLESLKTFRISGADTDSFLQGQLTTDISKLGSGWQLAGYCNPKGRLLGLLYLVRSGDDIIAILESSIAESVIKRLRMYVLRSKVTIDEIPSASIVAMPNSAGKLGELTEFNGLPCLHFGCGELLLNLEGKSDWFSDLGVAEDVEMQQLPESMWWSRLTRAGIPSITSETQELFVPQMVNLDLLGGVSFKKGCYTGQEIVARMHYLGKLKQRLFVCQCDAESGWLVGGKVVTEDGSSAGTISSPLRDATGLAVIRLEHRSAALMLENGESVTLAQPQPYPVDSA